MFYPLLLWGLFAFPTATRSSSARRRVWLDAAVVTVGGMMAVWCLVVGPTVQTHDAGSLEAVLNVAYPVGDLILVFGVAATLLRGSERSDTPALRLLLLGTVLLVVADLSYARLSLSDSYAGGDWPDAFRMAGQVLFLQSAHWHHHRQSTGSNAAADAQAGAGPVSILPYGAMAAGFVMLIVVGHGDHSYPRVGLSSGPSPSPC